VRLKDLDFTTWYATCDGQRAKIVKFDDDTDHPVMRRRYSCYPVYTEQGKEFTDPSAEPTTWTSNPGYGIARRDARSDVYLPTHGRVVETDPWGKCKTSRAQSNHDRAMRFMDGKWHTLATTNNRGIVVDVYRVTPDGEVIPKAAPLRMVYAQKDIPGTWLEYMTLHGEDVKERAERDAKQHEANAMQKAAQKRLDEIQRKHPSGRTAAGSDIRVTNHSFSEPGTFALTITLKGEDALKYARNTLRLPGLAHATVTPKGNLRIP
jgi:hypothetical protein